MTLDAFAQHKEHEFYEMERDSEVVNRNPLREITRKLAGHIRQPMSAHEIAAELESCEYSAELIMQHLLRLVDRMERIIS